MSGFLWSHSAFPHKLFAGRGFCLGSACSGFVPLQGIQSKCSTSFPPVKPDWEHYQDTGPGWREKAAQQQPCDGSTEVQLLLHTQGHQRVATASGRENSIEHQTVPLICTGVVHESIRKKAHQTLITQSAVPPLLPAVNAPPNTKQSAWRL